MRQALISDIHANLEALSAVMRHIDSQKVDRIICLGDIVGYGPDPAACIDIVMERCEFSILGNHDQAALIDPDGFNPVALRAIYWTRDQLDRGPGPKAKIDERWDFLGMLPPRKEEQDILYVHGSPRNPTNEYVFPETVFDEERMRDLSRRFNLYCFQGHTHMPGVFTTEGEFEFITPEDCDYVFPLNEEKIMVNVGSVGQPRDEDPRACYVILDTDKERIEFHRVEYDVETTVQKIYAIEELDDSLGNRLRTGR